VKSLPVLHQPALEGELITPSDWREEDDRYGVGSFVTREGTDVHKVVSLDGPQAIAGYFLCVKAPASGWCKIGETEFNMTRRYDPVEFDPTQTTQIDAAKKEAGKNLL
jgi:hypothetical protein